MDESDDDDENEVDDDDDYDDVFSDDEYEREGRIRRDSDDFDDEDMSSPLIAAAEAGDLRTVRSVLEQGTDINETTNWGCTALWHAVDNSFFEIVRLLLHHGADKEKANTQGENPMHLAARAGHLDIVKALVEHGANIQTVDDLSHSPLQLACRGGHYEVAEYLLEQGADRDVTNIQSDTPLHTAAVHGHLDIVKLLMIYGANLNARNDFGQLPIDFADNGEIKQAIRDEPRRRMDEAPGKRATEHENASTLASSAGQENGEAVDQEEEPNSKKSRLDQGEAEDGNIADEDQDSEPSDGEDDS